jgi:uncharacterized phage-associated protein
MNIYRKKLLNATLYFAKHTNRLNLTKLSKLLYFLDFNHFEQTGYPSIGLDYYAFERGPVPKEFWAEIKDGDVPEDFKENLALVFKNEAYREVEIHALGNPDMSIFSPREMKIIDELVFIYKNAKGVEISEISHLPKEPWDITRKTLGKNKLIDYRFNIDEKSPVTFDEADEIITEHFEVIHNFNLKPTK